MKLSTLSTIFLLGIGISIMISGCNSNSLGSPNGIQESFFSDITYKISKNIPRASYGIAVSDIDNDSRWDFIVSGFEEENLILSWKDNQLINTTPEKIKQAHTKTIALAACDTDGSGRESLYIVNSNQLTDTNNTADDWWTFNNGQWLNKLSVKENKRNIGAFAGRSVVCVDTNGDGKYGFYVTNYGGPAHFFEIDNTGLIQDNAPLYGFNKSAGGRSVLSGPLVSNGMDIFSGNERGDNFLFIKNSSQQYTENANGFNIADSQHNVRGAVLLDANEDGLLDIFYANWKGPRRLWTRDKQFFIDSTPPLMQKHNPSRNIIYADFDNDGFDELFINNLGTKNELYKNLHQEWVTLNPGPAKENQLYGTGAAIADIDNDGILELLVGHGEKKAQKLSLYKAKNAEGNFLRIMPLTQYGSPARGSKVTLKLKNRTITKVIDAGSAYLSQMEPVAHFGLGDVYIIESVTIHWPDGTEYTLDEVHANTYRKIPYPKK